MSASLVGSEMCIRDSGGAVPTDDLPPGEVGPEAPTCTATTRALPLWTEAVSYTHLTLPTICSV
eukprot:1050461-Alexandrium_andersonii.AAC.1